MIPSIVRTPNRVLPSNKGLSFDGVSDYLQLPSMTMDSIEIDCLIDSVQLNSFPKVLDARIGLGNGYVNADSSQSFGADWLSVYGRVKGQRTKVMAIAKSVFTDNVNIFSSSSNIEFTKGFLYSVTCYLNGNIVAQYDFENPSTISGNSVLQNPKNFLPNYNDKRWSLHANAQLLGIDYLRLVATGGVQDSLIELPLNPNSNYLYNRLGSGGTLWVKHKDNSGNLINGGGGSSTAITITVPYNAVLTQLIVGNGGAVGTFDFIKPHLYQLSTFDGTLNGAPKLLTKQSLRTLNKLR
jgi:hypothetical protein